eukprot:2089398-Amphidinium_carterae.3
MFHETLHTNYNEQSVDSPGLRLESTVGSKLVEWWRSGRRTFVLKYPSSCSASRTPSKGCDEDLAPTLCLTSTQQGRLAVELPS